MQMLIKFQNSIELFLPKGICSTFVELLVGIINLSKIVKNLLKESSEIVFNHAYIHLDHIFITERPSIIIIKRIKRGNNEKK